MYKNPQKILIVKLCCIGDIIFSIPLLKTIKYNIPEVKISYLHSDWCKNLVENIREVDSSLIFNAPFEKRSFRIIFDFFKLVRTIRNENFDVAINLHRNSIFGLIFFLSGIKTRIGFGSTIFYNKKEIFQPELPEPKRLLSLLNYFNFKTLFTKPEINLPEDKIEQICSPLKEFGLDLKRNTIAVFPDGGNNPGSTMQIRQLKKSKYIEVIKKISERYDVQIVIVSSKEKDGNAFKLYETLKDNKNLIFLPTISISEIQYLFKFCKLVIGGDTGLLHLAGAIGTPVIMFYGPSDPRLEAPVGEENKIIWHQIECAPCYTPISVMDKNNFKDGAFFCKRGDVLCMELITIEEILSAYKIIWDKIISN
jgi:lipopolysaccharide heptosyltransferase II